MSPTKSLLFPAFVFFALSCNNMGEDPGGGKADTLAESTDITEDTSEQAEVPRISYIVPSPIQMIGRLERVGVTYNDQLMNPVSSVTSYATNVGKSLNLGIYGTDLAYATMMNQTQSAMDYMKTIKKLNDELGMASVFQANSLVTRFEANINNRDSLEFLITELYRESDCFLNESERSHNAVLVLAGGWVEGLYLATRLAQKNKKLMPVIAEQGFSLNNLMLLLSQYEGNAAINETKNDLVSLKELYDTISLNIDDSDEGPTLTEEQLKKISSAVETIRGKLIKTS